MQISLKWLQNLLGFQKLTLEYLINKLTLVGFEIENLNKTKNDIILEINYTANRNDISNIKNLIIEINSIYNFELFLEIPNKIKILNIPNHKFKLSISKYKIYKKLFFFFRKKIIFGNIFLQKKNFLKNTLKQKNNNKVTSKHITLFQTKSNSINIKNSPIWLQKRLISMNFKPINNVIDTINYILIETGQSFFAYDIDKLKKITKASNLNFNIQFAKNNDLFFVSDSKFIDLKNNVLILSLNKKIITIAGIIQHFETLVNKKTSQILLQGNFYNSKQIQKSSKILNLKTDLSLKLEKQTDLNLIEQAYIRLIHLFRVQNIKFNQLKQKDFLFFSEKNLNLFYTYINYHKNNIKISYQNINQLIKFSQKTITLNKFKIIKDLNSLNFKIFLKTDLTFRIKIPLSRQLDIKREIDIIEEITRMNNFNEFYSIIPKNNYFSKITKLEKLKRRLRTYFLNLGFSENYQSTLTNKINDSQILLKNPLFKNTSTLRISLLNELIEKINFNNKQNEFGFETFELGRVYKSLYNNQITEIELISGVFGGKNLPTTWNNNNLLLNWYEAKGLIEEIFQKLNISIFWKNTNFIHLTNFHPTCSLNLYIKNQFIGTFGQIHPNLAILKDLNKKTYLFEFNLEILNYFWKNQFLISYKPYSFYPTSYIDLTFTIKRIFNFLILKNYIFNIGQPLLKSIKLFDYYSNLNLSKDYSNLSFKLQFQSKKRTLTNLETNKIITYVILKLKKKI
uniref:phenylalanyl tRNA synthetase beta subunit n=1 Tax=Choristocarpus tenellus TaxID=116065 RepID=UPI002E76624E|nr:phenylalanyl tRNA synthetase beta subunit [Choristocarpus tenellus]WAM62302.1 phenylalanyl tRNA synthetase beta subunit [Choristocarpus tenellus]